MSETSDASKIWRATSDASGRAFSPTGTSEAGEHDALLNDLRVFGMAMTSEAAEVIQAQGNLIERMASALAPFADACDSGVHPDDADRSKLAVRVEYLRAARDVLNHGRAEG